LGGKETIDDLLEAGLQPFVLLVRGRKAHCRRTRTTRTFCAGNRTWEE
jgi:hypothetical protein